MTFNFTPKADRIHHKIKPTHTDRFIMNFKNEEAPIFKVWEENRKKRLQKVIK